jgi:hypothetical protein
MLTTRRSQYKLLMNSSIPGKVSSTSKSPLVFKKTLNENSFDRQASLPVVSLPVIACVSNNAKAFSLPKLSNKALTVMRCLVPVTNQVAFGLSLDLRLSSVTPIQSHILQKTVCFVFKKNTLC